MEILFEVRLRGRDRLTIYKNDQGKTMLQVDGCAKLNEHVQNLCKKFGANIQDWTVEAPLDHEHFLIKKLKNEVNQIKSSYVDNEICHCRNVPTQVVEDSIFNGAKNIEAIRRQTSASTACGSCFQDIDKLLKFWIEENN